MSFKTVAILSPGEMGHNLALVLGRHGLKVITCLQGRSQRTQELARRAGIATMPTLEAVVEAADLILSVVPPAAAPEVAQSVALALGRTGKSTLFADANAISPMTSEDIWYIISSSGGRYVDVSIIGSARNLETGTTLYASGPFAPEFAQIQSFGLKVKTLGEQIGQASALKMVYAGLTKGLSALAVELLLTAQALGILDQIIELYHSSHPEIARFMEHTLPGLPFRAARRSQEMEELSATIEHEGLAPIMASASREMLRAIGELGLASRYSEAEESHWKLREVMEILFKEFWQKRL